MMNRSSSRAAVASSRATPQQHSVVVVDNDSAVRHSLEFFLNIEGYQVLALTASEAANADSELQAAACLIVDYSLPETDGLEFVDRLRRRGHQIPTILIASHTDDRLLKRARIAGVEVVEKPLLGDVLNVAIERVIAAR